MAEWWIGICSDNNSSIVILLNSCRFFIVNLRNSFRKHGYTVWFAPQSILNILSITSCLYTFWDTPPKTSLVFQLKLNHLVMVPGHALTQPAISIINFALENVG